MTSGLRQEICERVSKARFVDAALPAAAEDYDEAVSAYLSAIPLVNVLSVYQVGSVGAPGLSDIDLLVVARNERPDLLPRYEICRLHRRQRYLFMHNPWVMDVQAFSNLAVWFPYRDLRLVWGQELATRPAASAGADLPLLHIVNYILTKIPSSFLGSSFLHGEFRERTTIALLNSLRHTLHFWELSGGPPQPGAPDFLTRVDGLRSGWYRREESERREDLREVLLAAVEVSLHLIGDVAGRLAATWLAPGAESALRDGRDWAFPGPGCESRFVEGWDRDRALEEAVSSSGARFLYPKELALLPLALSAGDGLVARHLQRSFRPAPLPNLRLRPDPAQTVAVYGRTVEDYASFHARKFRKHLSGFHTFWAPHAPRRATRFLDLAVYGGSRLLFLTASRLRAGGRRRRAEPR